MTTVESAASAASSAKATASGASGVSDTTERVLAYSTPWGAEYTLATIALVAVIAALLIAAWVILRSGDEVKLEVRKIRFAAATFTGILILFVFAAILYFADSGPLGAGKDIFEKAVTAMTPLAGVIVGYLFGTRKSGSRKARKAGSGSARTTVGASQPTTIGK